MPAKTSFQFDSVLSGSMLVNESAVKCVATAVSAATAMSVGTSTARTGIMH